MLTIVFTTVILLLPMNISVIVMLVYKNSVWSETSKQLVFIAAICTHINALKDPLAYIFIKKNVKREICKYTNNIMAMAKMSGIIFLYITNN